MVFRVAGAQLAERILRPFEHLRTPDTHPGHDALTVDLWDENETGIGCDGCVALDDLLAPDDLARSPDGRYVLHTRPQTKSCFDRRGARIVGWVGKTERLTQYEAGRPLHSQLLLWHRDQGMQAVHAGLVARSGEGVLFGGAGGSGKTTTALTCLMRGFSFLADDYVGLEPAGDGEFVGHSLYSSSHFEPEHLQRFPELLPHAAPGKLPIEDKHLVLLPDVFPTGFAHSARIRAVALPRVQDIPTSRLRPARRGEALLRLAPSSILMLPHAGVSGGGFENMADLVASVPVYWLDLGRDLDSIPERVGELLALGLGT